MTQRFAPRLGLNLLWLVPATAVVASLTASILVFAGIGVIEGSQDAFLGGLLLSVFAAMVALFFVLGGLLVLALPFTLALRAANVTWLVVVGIAVVLSVGAGALFGAAQDSPEFPWIGMIYAIVTAMTWLLALRLFAQPVQSPEIDDLIPDAA